MIAFLINTLAATLKSIHRYWLPLTVFLLGLITWLSLQTPTEQLTSVGNDKLHHCLAYAVLAFPVAMAKPRWYILYLLSMFFYSGLIEVIQPWFYRQMDVIDLLANSIGLLLGLCIAMFLNKAVVTPSSV